MGNGQSSSSSQPVDGRAGYVDPEEQARRDRQDKQFDEAMNSNGTRIYQQRAAEDAKVNAAAAGGGFKMDIAAMKALQPEWQGIADGLNGMIRSGRQLRAVTPPASDDGSSLQKRAADMHADAYLTSLQQQQAYAQGYADKLKDAIGKYEKQDQANTSSLNKQG